MGNDVFGLIYTGESSMQLRDLTYSRSVAAVPFAGRYRCIDFIMSNLVNTGISNVGIIAQKNYHSLMDHLGSGKSWDLSRNHGGLTLLPAFAYNEKRGAGGQYRGRKWFFDVIVGAESETSDFVNVISSGTDDEDGDIQLFPQHAADGKAVRAGEHQIQEDQVRLKGRKHTQSFLPVVDNLTLKTFFGKIKRYQFGDVVVIVYNHYFLFGYHKNSLL